MDIPAVIDGVEVKSIGYGVFFHCKSLESVTLPDSLVEIGNYAFADCPALQEIVIPEGVESIGDYSFGWCTSLADVTLPESLKVIGAASFEGCTSLAHIDIPAGVEDIVDGAFWDCTSLESIVIPDGIEHIKLHTFQGCTSLAEVTIPDSVIEVAANSFQDCTSLTHVYFPNCFTAIGDEAFSGCTSLTDVTLPYGFNCLRPRAFSGCTSLKTVTFSSEVWPICEDVFAGTDSLTDIYYIGTEEQWNDFASKVDFGRDMTGVNIHFKKTFDDAAPGGYFTDAVEWAAAYKFADPKSDTSFGTEDPCPRGEVVDIIWRAAGSPKPTSDVNPFTAVTPDNEYYDAILWAAEKGVTNGRGDGTFGVNDTVTRAQAVTFLYRAAGAPEISYRSAFTDVADGEYYSLPVLWAVDNQITNGTGDNKFSPEALISRGQLVTFAYRWITGEK